MRFHLRPLQRWHPAPRQLPRAPVFGLAPPMPAPAIVESAAAHRPTAPPLFYPPAMPVLRHLATGRAADIPPPHRLARAIVRAAAGAPGGSSPATLLALFPYCAPPRQRVGTLVPCRSPTPVPAPNQLHPARQ